MRCRSMDNYGELLQLGKQLMNENYPFMQVTDITIMQSGGIKTIWKMDTPTGSFCLKRIRKTIDSVKFTTAAQDYLYNKGALVAEIMLTRDGQLFFIHEGYALVLYSWIEGADLEMDENLEHLCTGIKGLAQFHRESVGFIPPVDCEVSTRMGKWPEYYRKMAEHLIDWKMEAQKEMTPFHLAYLKTVDEMVDMAYQAILLIEASTYSEWVKQIGNYGYLCHQDYGPGNALETEQGVYVLDHDNLTYDIPLRDVRKLIVKRMDEMEHWDQDELKRIIGWYETVFPLTPEQRHILYIDLLFPNEYYGDAKNPFKKGKRGEAGKIITAYEFEIEKQAILSRLLQAL